jgi:hypothetical protein
MRRMINLTVVVMLLWFIFLTPQGKAFYKTLNDKQIQEAIDYGKTSKTMDLYEFCKGYRFSTLGKDDKEICIVATPYMMIAYYCKKQAQQYQDVDMEGILYTAKRGAIIFSISAYGDEIGFATKTHSIVKVDSLIIHPTEKRNPPSADVTQNFPQSPAFKAICEHAYETEQIPANREIELIFIYGNGKEVKFRIDLSKMK